MSTRSTIAQGKEGEKSDWHLFSDFYEEPGTLVVRVEQKMCAGNYADDLDGVNVRLTPSLIDAIVRWRTAQGVDLDAYHPSEHVAGSMRAAKPEKK